MVLFLYTNFKGGVFFMKTSILICKIVKNEGKLEYSKLVNYVEELIKMGFLTYDNETSSVVLTEKGLSYTDNIK